MIKVSSKIKKKEIAQSNFSKPLLTNSLAIIPIFYSM